jgi:opacity protein-like surface antigen
MNTARKQSFFFLAALGVACLLSPGAFAAVDTTAGFAGFQYLDIPPSPRQIAMGWTGTALGKNGFAYYNPASPAIDKTSFLSVGYAPLPYDYSVEHAQGSFMISDFFLGANITNHVVSGIYPTDFNREPDYNTPFSYDGTLVALNAGYASDRLGIGLTLNGLQEQIGTATAYGVSASVGLTYALTGNIMLGAAGLHLGTSTGFTDDTKNFGEGYPLPRSARAGAAFTDTLYRVPFTASGDIVYRDVGIRGTPISERLNRMTVPLGIEVCPTSYVAVRIGKRLNYDAELLTFGAGVHWSVLTFDLAIVLAQIVSDVQVQPFFSLTYSLRPAVRELPNVKTPASVPVIIEKPVEVKSAPAPASPVADTAAAQSIAPVKAPGPASAPQDTAAPVPENQGRRTEPNPVEQIGNSPQADSLQTKPPAPPAQR